MGIGRIIRKKNNIPSNLKRLAAAFNGSEAIQAKVNQMFADAGNPQNEERLLRNGVITESMKKDIFNVQTLLILLNEIREIEIYVQAHEVQIDEAIKECTRSLEAEEYEIEQKIMLAQRDTESLEAIKSALENAIREIDRQINKLSATISLLEMQLGEIQQESNKVSDQIQSKLHDTIRLMAEEKFEIHPSINKKSLISELKIIAGSVHSKSAHEIDTDITHAINSSRLNKSVSLTSDTLNSLKKNIYDNSLVRLLNDKAGFDGLDIEKKAQLSQAKMGMKILLADKQVKNSQIDSLVEIIKQNKNHSQSSRALAQTLPSNAIPSSTASTFQRLQNKVAKATAPYPHAAVAACCNIIKSDPIAKAVAAHTPVVVARKRFDETPTPTTPTPNKP